MPKRLNATEPITLFHPHVPEAAAMRVLATLQTRWIGQGPCVDEFERRFAGRFAPGRGSVAVSSGTSALHLAYILAGVKDGDEVVTPVFTCTATNIPLLYQRAKPVFADVQRESLNIDPSHVRQLVTSRTRAIVCVHYGGLPCDMDELHSIGREWGIPVIEDAAQSLGATYRGKSVGAMSEFTAFSFQAIKHLTTGDGGMLSLADPELSAKAKRLRWFGIDREAKHAGTWEQDICELGYKYQMTDIAAALGLGALEEFDRTLKYRQALLAAYRAGLKGIAGIEMVGGDYPDREHAAWICTVLADRRQDLQRVLSEAGIESDPVHFRNDRYSIFSGTREPLPNMDAIEDRYLVLPLHLKMSIDDVERVCATIRKGW